MLRQLLIFGAIAVVFGASAPLGDVLADSGAIPMPDDRAADSYEIYSLLMPGAPFDSMGSVQSQSWAIADTTVSISDMNPAIPPEGQLQAPDDHPRRFQEALHDFEARKYQRLQLTDHFRLSQPHKLLNSSQVDELRRAKTAVDAGSDLQSKYAAYPGVTFFSQVYFNAGHGAALVYMNNWCANLCQQGQWIYLEKQNGSWVRRSGIYEKMSSVPAGGARADSGVPLLPSGSAADSYAIYSLLLPGARFDHISPRNVRRWGLADTTINISDMNPAIPPRGQLKAPPDNVEAFDEAARDFEARKFQRFQLKDGDDFHLSRAYPLLDEHRVKDLRRSASVDNGITYFSAVYFNNKQTAALVYVNVWCANLCSAGEWVYLEKQGSSWVRRSGIYRSGA
jgi:hypothetical protein